MQEKAIKGSVAGIGTIITYLSGNFTPLIYIMVIFEILDYITGIVSAKMSGKGVSSKVATQGFVKKVYYFVLVGVAFGFDFVIVETTSILGFDFGWPAFFGVLSVCYLLSTEAISILENLQELGIKVPFLTSALKIYREKISNKGDKVE